MMKPSFGQRGIDADAPTVSVKKTSTLPVPAKVAEQDIAPNKARDELRVSLFTELLDVIDLTELARMSPDRAKEEVGDVVRTLLASHQNTLNLQEQEAVVLEITNDVLGLGPLEVLLKRDDISDIMVCGPKKVYIEVKGLIELTDVKFRDEAQLINICRRIVSAVGRRVDESSPLCDARLADGSRVAIVVPPLSPDGTTLTIRKFRKDKLQLNELVKYGSLSKAAALLIQIISQCRCNVLISGGTGSGKTTLLNCVTRYIDAGERIITIEDAMELQLQQPHVVRWETRPPNLEGVGEITMSMLVKAALRHRPERIIIGEVRGKEAFDLLQAMNTGHDGSAGTVHANSPREAIGRVESMIATGGWNMPARQVREQIVSSLDIIIQATRLRDGSRRVTHITEVIGMEGETPTLQDLMVFEQLGEDANGRIIGRHKMTGMRPHMFDKARDYMRDGDLMKAMQDQVGD
jgi:pilus assembly protein CpaF